MQYRIYFLYSDPVEWSRTGHTAILISRENEERAEIVRYFSMYHAILPDAIRSMSLKNRFTDSIQPAFVSDYSDDVIMRGQSLARYVNKEEENMTVPDFLKALPNLSVEQRERYFGLGQFHHVLELPCDTFDPQIVVERLDSISFLRNSYGWAMCSPLAQILFSGNTHNCCSAISESLSFSKKNYRSQNIVFGITKVSIVAGLFAFYGLSKNQDEHEMSPLYYAPLIFPLMLALQAMYRAHFYVIDLKAMAKKEGPGLLTLVTGYLSLAAVYLFCAVVNLLGSAFTDNLCAALFLFPGSLARGLRNLSGAKEVPVSRQSGLFFSQSSEHRLSKINDSAEKKVSVI
jgi:hypothetical protein